MVRPDMESATPQRQSLQAASVKLPAELSASSGAGATLGAMMGDRSLRKRWEVWVQGESCSSRQREGGARDLLAKPRRCSIRFAIAQRGVADARHLVGQRARRLVVVGATLHRQCPVAQVIDGASCLTSHAGGAQHRACPMGEQHAQVPIPALGDTPRMVRAAGGMLLGGQAEPGGEVARIAKVAHIAAGGCHHGGSGQKAHAWYRQERGAGRARRHRQRPAGKRTWPDPHPPWAKQR